MIYLTKPEIFNPSFEIVSCICECDKEILLLLRQDNKIEGNKWGLPAGKIEPNESLDEAIKREILEETGLKLAPAEINYFKTVYVKYTTKDFIDNMFYARFNLEPEIKISLKEHKSYTWKTVKKALKMDLLPGQAECFKLFYEI